MVLVWDRHKYMTAINSLMACQPHSFFLNMCYHFATLVFVAGYKSGELLIPNKTTFYFRIDSQLTFSRAEISF
jgi:hypothetical protein